MGNIKDITVKYFEIEEPSYDRIKPEHSFYEGILAITEKFTRELKREETPGKIGYKVYYDSDGFIEKMKQFDKKGNYLSSTSDIQKIRRELQETIERQSQEEEEEIREWLDYSHVLYYYNKKGKGVREEVYDENNEIQGKTLYYYDTNGHLKKLVDYDYVESTTKTVVEFSNTKDGILMNSQMSKNDKLQQYSKLSFFNNKKIAIINTYDRDDCIIRSVELKKVCDVPVQCDLQNHYISYYNIPLMKRGYRFSKENRFDIDGDAEEERRYYHNKEGNLITKKFFEQYVLGLYFSRFYVYRLNKNQLQKESRYCVEKDDEKHILTLFSEKDYLQDREGKLIKITTNHPLDKEKYGKIFKYNKKGQLIENYDSRSGKRDLTFYDNEGRIIREETHYPDEPSPTDYSTYTYDKTGKLTESEFSLSIKIP